MGFDSAAASWACCTWRSCRSASSASTTWTSSSRRRPSVELKTSRARSRSWTTCEDAGPEERSAALRAHGDIHAHGLHGVHRGARAEPPRGAQDVKYLTPTRTSIIYELPLAEVITDFFDEMKPHRGLPQWVRTVAFFWCARTRLDSHRGRGADLKFLCPPRFFLFFFPSTDTRCSETEQMIWCA